MPQLDLQPKLAILADAAKYDASCASSGTSKRDSRGGKGIGSTEGMGICHAYAPDGRCISLLKILLTNSCIFDCHYCINRKSSNVRRARFTAEEVVRLTLAFYRRNYIEGLFLSSGIIRSSNYTMEQLVEVARMPARGPRFPRLYPSEDHPRRRSRTGPAGRALCRPGVDQRRAADRPPGCRGSRPRRTAAGSRARCRTCSASIDEARTPKKRYKSAPRLRAGRPVDADDRRRRCRDRRRHRRAAPARSTTASACAASIIRPSRPIPDASAVLPLQRPPLMREHRLYQSDWLMRFYGFAPAEVVGAADDDGMLPLDIDPKLAWALKFRESFPVDVNRAPRETAVARAGPGREGGRRNPARARRWRRLRLEDVARLTRVDRQGPAVHLRRRTGGPTSLTDRADLRALARAESRSSWSCSRADSSASRAKDR